ncbi:regulatory protein ArsR [Spirochaeta thermophila DSM 6578]|uniref:Regulatory protein ArsR n=1 Tax=Winmispira thermophila (strain ATCC 700085 / DSM 6578 / Z-1203) TaxID=869211 RepID=G0GG68_WINT7|nr:transcriptional regulator [Spirochaeta thermophila]AEJ62544.1 regulatory protein ArsR [Spirochaeta thermophila DSM 6578]
MLYTQFDQVFFERTRLSLITILYRDGRASFLGLKRALGLTDGALYSHLEKLVTAGYVGKEKELVGDGVQTVYFLTEKGRREFQRYLSFVEEVLSQRSTLDGGDR